MHADLTGSIAELESQSKWLARSSIAERQACFEALNQDALGIAVASWKNAIEAYKADDDSDACDDDEGPKVVEVHILEQQKDLATRAILQARILRNVVAGVPQAQAACLSIFPEISDVLWHTTSFRLEGTNDLRVLTRTLVQLLSNTVTGNETLQDQFWKSHMIDARERSSTSARGAPDLLARLLAFPDEGCQTAVQVLLLNCTLHSDSRSDWIVSSDKGQILAKSMLAALQSTLEKEDQEADETGGPEKGTTPAAANRIRMDAIGVSYTFFTNLFDRQLAGRLLVSLGPPPSSETQGSFAASKVTAAQICMLKTLDSYLHFGPVVWQCTTEINGFSELLLIFRDLSVWAEGVMAEAVKQGTEAEVDARLIEVHTALILLLQCLITLGLKTEDSTSSSERVRMAAYAILAEMRNDTFVEGLLCSTPLSAFAPPISPFRPSKGSAAPSPTQPAPAGHALTSTGLAQEYSQGRADPGLDYLKRDIVNLLGVLSYQRINDDKTAVRRVQDVIREAGGLFDVMNMTQLDERNPYIRERAIFTLRNLLQGNQASQDLIAQLRPVAPTEAA